MAKKRSFKRDKKGRFAGSGSSSSTSKSKRSGPVKALRAKRIKGHEASLKGFVASERSYTRQTGDVGTKADQARFRRKVAKKRAKISKLKAKQRR